MTTPVLDDAGEPLSHFEILPEPRSEILRRLLEIHASRNLFSLNLGQVAGTRHADCLPVAGSWYSKTPAWSMVH